MPTIAEQGITPELNDHRTGLHLRVPRDMCFTTESLMASLHVLSPLAFMGEASATLRAKEGLLVHIPLSLTGSVTMATAWETIRKVEQLELPLKQPGRANSENLDLLVADSQARAVAIDPRQRLTADAVTKWLTELLEHAPNVRWAVQTQGRYFVVRLHDMDVPEADGNDDAIAGYVRKHGQLVSEEEMCRLLPARYSFAVWPEARVLGEDTKPLGKAIISLKPHGTTNVAFDCDAVHSVRGVETVEIGSLGQLIVQYSGREARITHVDKLMAAMADVTLHIIRVAGAHVGIADDFRLTLSGFADNDRLTGDTTIRRPFRAQSLRA